MSLPVIIPNSMTEQMTSDSETDWLSRLPGIVEGCARHWELRLGEPLEPSHVWMKVNYIVPAILPGGREVVLKVLSSPRTFRREHEALKHTCRESAVELVNTSEEWSALLLERVRPGVPLSEMADDEENTRIAASIMRSYWRPPPEKHGLQSVSYRIGGLSRLRERYGGGTGPVPELWVSRAESAFVELAIESKGDRLLHGDLHQWNILSSDRIPWLAIDPQGFYGDPGYDLHALLGNLPEKSCAGRDSARIRARRADVLAEELCVDREWVLTWAWACSALYAALYPHEWENHIARAEEFFSLT
ncbi:MAG: phosphotransferase [Candidatus Latescibacteria bacterium]|nr:phosphotransferase [Candidatus Latescibacterota bacterium]